MCVRVCVRVIVCVRVLAALRPSLYNIWTAALTVTDRGGGRAVRRGRPACCSSTATDRRTDSRTGGGGGATRGRACRGHRRRSLLSDKPLQVQSARQAWAGLGRPRGRPLWNREWRRFGRTAPRRRSKAEGPRVSRPICLRHCGTAAGAFHISRCVVIVVVIITEGTAAAARALKIRRVVVYSAAAIFWRQNGLAPRVGFRHGQARARSEIEVSCRATVPRPRLPPPERAPGRASSLASSLASRAGEAWPLHSGTLCTRSFAFRAPICEWRKWCRLPRSLRGPAGRRRHGARPSSTQEPPAWSTECRPRGPTNAHQQFKFTGKFTNIHQQFQTIKKKSNSKSSVENLSRIRKNC